MELLLGHNNVVLAPALELLIGSKVLGIYNDQIKNMALDALNYILGANAMRKSFVTDMAKIPLKRYFLLLMITRQGVAKGFMPLGC